MGGWRELVKPTDGIISRTINRRISYRITMAIISAGVDVSPNEVSVWSFLLAVIASLLYLTGNPIPAGIMVQISSIIDGVDGELARLKGIASRFGAYFDALLDRLADIAIIVSYVYYTSKILGLGVGPTTCLLAFVLTGDLLVSYIHARGEASIGRSPILVGSVPSYASRDVRLFIIFIGSVIGGFISCANLITLVVVSVLAYSYVILKTMDLYMCRHVYEVVR